jgi:phosphoribosylformylglycinamidine cyclo-ligase
VVVASGLALGDALPGGAGESVGSALLEPHRWYGPSVLPLAGAGRLHALAHVTGGGLAGNLARVLPEGCRARLLPGAWPRPPVFRWLIAAGAVPEQDARRTFNLGIGLVAVVDRSEADAVGRELEAAGERVWNIGDVVAGPRGVEWVED